MLFSTPAYAQATTAAGGPADIFMSLMPLLLLFVLFYVMILRPQQKRAKAHKAMVEGLKRGDMVITSSGFIGKVAKVSDDEVMLELGENVKVRMLKADVAELRGKPVPVPANDKSSDKPADKASTKDQDA